MRPGSALSRRHSTGCESRRSVGEQALEAYAALGRIFYLSGAPEADGSAVSQALASVESWVQAVLDVGRRTGAVRADLPVGLQSRLVFAVLRALDEWAVQNLDTIAAEQWPQLMGAQKTAVRRLLATDAVDPGSASGTATG